LHGLVRSLVVVVAVAASLLVACGEAPARDTAPFCEQLRALQEADPFAGSAGDEEALDTASNLLDDLVRAAPFALKEDLRILRRVVDDLNKIDTSSSGGASEAAGIVANPRVLSAARNVAGYGQRECGLSLPGG
jgi:hypothetical protein